MAVDEIHEAARAAPCLEEGEVHLWWGRDAVESLDALRTSLSDEEWRRGERFRQERDARAYLFRRAFRRRVLAGYVGDEPRDVAFVQGEFGKPFLARRDVDLRFSASSSRGLVLLALCTGREIGIDLEHQAGLGRAEELSGLARRILTASEWRAFETLAGAARPRALLRAWTRKEAVLKALGTGLSREPGSVEVGLTELVPGADSRAASWTGWGQAFDLAAPAGHLASLVAATRPGQATRLVRPRGAPPGPAR